MESLLDLVIERIFYWPGLVVLRVLTLGQYPPPAPKDHNKMFVATIGLLAFLTPPIIYALSP